MVIQFVYIVASILNFRLLEIVPTLFREAYGQILLFISCIRQINHKTNPAQATVTESPYMTQLNGGHFA